MTAAVETGTLGVSIGAISIFGGVSINFGAVADFAIGVIVSSGVILGNLVCDVNEPDLGVAGTDDGPALDFLAADLLGLAAPVLKDSGGIDGPGVGVSTVIACEEEFEVPAAAAFGVSPADISELVEGESKAPWAMLESDMVASIFRIAAPDVSAKEP